MSKLDFSKLWRFSNPEFFKRMLLISCFKQSQYFPSTKPRSSHFLHTGTDLIDPIYRLVIVDDDIIDDSIEQEIEKIDEKEQEVTQDTFSMKKYSTCEEIDEAMNKYIEIQKKKRKRENRYWPTF